MDDLRQTAYDPCRLTNNIDLPDDIIEECMKQQSLYPPAAQRLDLDDMLYFEIIPYLTKEKDRKIALAKK